MSSGQTSRESTPVMLMPTRSPERTREREHADRHLLQPLGGGVSCREMGRVLLLAPVLYCMLFMAFDALFGDLRASPWGILAFSLVSFYAPEGGLSGLIYLLTFGTEILVFCAFFATWFAPIFAIPILGPDRQGFRVPVHSNRSILLIAGRRNDSIHTGTSLRSTSRHAFQRLTESAQSP